MPDTMEWSDTIGVDRAKGRDFTACTFICCDCDRTEHRPDDAIPEGWDLIETDSNGTWGVRCPDCNEKIEQAFSGVLGRRTDETAEDHVCRLLELAKNIPAPRAFTVFLEKQDSGEYRVAMTPETALMRWMPLGFFLSPAEAHTLANELRTFAILAERPGTIPSEGDRK